MATINYAAREINVKIVYYGPALSGKTTNLQIIHKKTPDESKSDMVSLATEADRTLFFDFLPIDLGKIRGFSTKIQLYTVPGQVYYNATRKLVLRGVDGIVFVADSVPEKMPENIESLNNMEENLAEYGYNLDSIPIVIQLNKRDMPGALSVEELSSQLNRYNAGICEATARTGEGVFQTLKMIGKVVIDCLNAKYSSPGSASGMAASQLPPLSQMQKPAFQPAQPQQQFAQPQQQFAQPQQQFAQPQQQFAQPQQQFAQPQQQFAQPQQQFAQPQQQFAQPQQPFTPPTGSPFTPPTGSPFTPPASAPFTPPTVPQPPVASPTIAMPVVSPDDPFELDFDSVPTTPTATPVSAPVQPVAPQQSAPIRAPQTTSDSAFDDLVFDEPVVPVAKPTPLPQKKPIQDLELDFFDSAPAKPAPAAVAPTMNQQRPQSNAAELPFDAQIAGAASNQPVDINSFFSNEPRAAASPFETSNDTIAMPAVGTEEMYAEFESDEESDGNDQPFIFTNVNGENVRGKKKPVNPKYKKNFLDNLFNK